MQSVLSCLGMNLGTSATDQVDVLVLGGGWSWYFLESQLKAANISKAVTTRDGRNGSIKFSFDPNASEQDEDVIKSFEQLPNAKTVIIVFPIYGPKGSKRLVDLYLSTHEGSRAGFIQLGSAGIWGQGQTFAPDEKKSSIWIDRHSRYDTSNARAIAEDELLAMSTKQNPTTVLNLAGLWGNGRSVRNFMSRVIKDKESLANKNALYMVAGDDVAQVCIAAHGQWSKAEGQRWIVTDLRNYDWWDLASKYGTGGIQGKDKPVIGPEPQWALELMQEKGIRCLPRTPEELGRAYDSRELWSTFGITPLRPGLD